MNVLKTYHGYKLIYDKDTVVGTVKLNEKVLIENIKEDNETKLIKTFHKIVVEDQSGKFDKNNYKDLVVSESNKKSNKQKAAVDVKQEFKITNSNKALPNPMIGDILCNINADILIPEDCLIVIPNRIMNTDDIKSDEIDVMTFDTKAAMEGLQFKRDHIKKSDLAQYKIIGSVYPCIRDIESVENTIRRVKKVIEEKVNYYVDVLMKSDQENFDDIIDYISRMTNDDNNISCDRLQARSWLDTLQKIKSMLDE